MTIHTDIAFSEFIDRECPRNVSDHVVEWYYRIWSASEAARDGRIAVLERQLKDLRRERDQYKSAIKIAMNGIHKDLAQLRVMISESSVDDQPEPFEPNPPRPFQT